MAKPSYQFKPDWKTSALTLLLLPLLLSLGNWQLDREREKRDILATFESRQSGSALPLDAHWDALTDAQAARFQAVEVQGHWRTDSAAVLLDNKVQAGSVGYEVIQAFALSSEREVWINRGWLAAPRLRSESPEIPPLTQQTIRATIYVPLGESFTLQQQGLSERRGERIIAQRVDMAQLSALNDSETFPYLLRIAPESTDALSAQWPAINTKPAKHRGYAVQWFAMALALVIFYIIRSVEKR